MENDISKFVGKMEIKAIERIGDLMIPQTEDFPSFSQLGCVEHVDDIFLYAPPEDMNDLKMLLKTLSLMPETALKGIIKLMTDNSSLPETVASTFRIIDTGIRGIIFTLYYSGKTGKNYNGKTPLEIIGYEINRIPL